MTWADQHRLEELTTMLGDIERRLYLLPDGSRQSVQVWLGNTKNALGGFQSGQLGFLPYVIAAGVLAAGSIGAWIYANWRKAKQLQAYMDCLERHENQGLTPEEAARICNPFEFPKWAWVLLGIGAVLVIGPLVLGGSR